MALTGTRITELFHVDVAKGTLFNKRAMGRAKKGKRAGYITDAGYRIIGIDRMEYFEHNLMWFLDTGEWPPNGYEIDHKNRKKGDNRIKNLRLATRAQNIINADLRSDNRSGHRGVYFDTTRGKYSAQVTFGGKTKTLGRFDSLEEAAEAAAKARKRVYGGFFVKQVKS